jgi:hypothetical protein
VHTCEGVHKKNREQKKNHFFAACPSRPSREKKLSRRHTNIISK